MAMTQLEKLQYEYNRATDPAKKANWKKKIQEYKANNPTPAASASTSSSTSTAAPQTAAASTGEKTQLEKLQFEKDRATDPAKKKAWQAKIDEYKKKNPTPVTDSTGKVLSTEAQTGNESSDAMKATDDVAATAAAEKWYADGSLGRLEDNAVLNPADPSAAATIAQREAAYERALQSDPNIEAALQRHLQGLDGITAPENQALRESGSRAIKQQAKTQMRALRGFNLKNNVTSGYGGYAIQRDLGRNLANQETDLIAANVAEKGRRLSAFGDYAGQAYNTYNTARSGALDRLSQDRLAQQNLRIGADQYNMGRTRDQALFNLQQREKEKTGNLGVYYGNIGLDTARRAQDFEKDLAEKEYELAKKGLKG